MQCDHNRVGTSQLIVDQPRLTVIGDYTRCLDCPQVWIGAATIERGETLGYSEQDLVNLAVRPEKTGARSREAGQ